MKKKVKKKRGNKGERDRQRGRERERERERQTDTQTHTQTDVPLTDLLSFAFHQDAFEGRVGITQKQEQPGAPPH